jgi:hypothetical protein
MRILGVILALSVNLGAAEFRNLGFDEANTNNLVNVTGNPSDRILFGPATEMLPGWTIYSGTNTDIRVAPVGFNAVLGGPGYVTLLTPSFTGLAVTNGYSLFLQPATPNPPQERPYNLVQSGDIPLGARSVRFINYGDRIDLSINNTPVGLSYDARGSLPNFSDVPLAFAMGDVTQFAGQNVDLRFTTSGSGPLRQYGLDMISFSPEPVPEFGVPVSTLFGGMLLFLGRRTLRC